MAVAEIPGLFLPGRYQEMLRKILADHLPEAEVWAYGSRVSGDAREGSDLDLVVRRPGALDTETPGLSRLRGAFSESNIPIRVDVFDWARVPEEFRQEILRGYVVVQPGV